MDNPILKINGLDYERLEIALKLALTDEHGFNYKVNAFETNAYGLVLYTSCICPKDVIKLPFPIDLNIIFPFVKGYLETFNQSGEYEFITNDIILEDYERPYIYNGEILSELGWEVYTMDNGRIRDCDAIAIKPVWCWYGK